MPLYELQSSLSGDRAIGLRHDIDSNPQVALRMARHLARHGVCGSFYLLHTAPYYGKFQNGNFLREPLMRELVLNFIVSGCELGLHNDVYGIYAKRVNGAKKLKQELDWLRSLGATIRGTVAHNTCPLYGLENYEIFKERALWKRKTKFPLAKISEKKLGLTYEGSFASPKKNIDLANAKKFCSNLCDANIRSKEWMKQYLVNNPCCDWDIDYQFWLIGKDNWVVAGTNLFEWNIDLDIVLQLIKDLPTKTTSVIVIHPDYFELESNKEFDYQWKNLPSKYLEFNNDRVAELIKFTKLKPEFFDGKKCLDVGCGSGRYTYALQELGGSVTSFDISTEAVKKCRMVNPNAYAFDLLALDPNPIYDFVLCWGVLHHLPDPRYGFSKISTQVKSNGILHIMVYHKDTQHLYDKLHKKWHILSHEERVYMCNGLVLKYGGDHHGWWDALNPKFKWSFHHKEIKTWFKEEGYKNIIMITKRNINMRGIKK